MSQWTPALDTTDQRNWDDEGVELFIEHVAKEFDGGVGIIASSALRSGNIQLQRKAMAHFFRDKLPGGETALAHLGERLVTNDIPQPTAPFTLEEWEDRTLEKAARTMALSPKAAEQIAAKTGENVDDVRRQLWKKVFMGYAQETWRARGHAQR